MFYRCCRTRGKIKYQVGPGRYFLSLPFLRLSLLLLSCRILRLKREKKNTSSSLYARSIAARVCTRLVLEVVSLSPVGLFHRGDLHLEVVPLLVVDVAQLFSIVGRQGYGIHTRVE